MLPLMHAGHGTHDAAAALAGLNLLHAVAAVVCVLAAVAMVGTSRSRRVRAGHVVTTVAMVALSLWMHSIAVTVMAAVALTLTATALVLAERSEESRACALDLAACAGLVVLMAVPALLAASGHSAMPAAGEDGLHARVHAMVPGSADHAVGLFLTAAALVAVWAVARRRHPDPRSGSTSSAAAWLMMLAMAAMVAS